jgi:hypothetical protein
MNIGLNVPPISSMIFRKAQTVTHNGASNSRPEKKAVRIETRNGFTADMVDDECYVLGKRKHGKTKSAGEKRGRALLDLRQMPFIFNAT